MKPIAAITIGDCNGIGPEVVLKSLRSPRVRRSVVPLLVGNTSAFSRSAHILSLPFRPRTVNPDAEEIRRAWRDGFVPVVEPPGVEEVPVNPGICSAAAGEGAVRALECSVGLIASGTASGIVTAPVSKRALHLAGVGTPGQTELLQRLSGARHVAMMLVSAGLRVGLATIHTPLNAVARELTRPLLRERIALIEEALRRDWGIVKPRIAVLGLNPHAGEGGDLGTEERRIIDPVLRTLRARGLTLAGPFPADAFFARYAPGVYDAVVAMYHDQGLIPLKMTAGGKGVNVSVGLPLVRTSPDHGTAFDIAGKGTADPSSMIEAIALAALFIRNRSKRIPGTHP